MAFAGFTRPADAKNSNSCPRALAAPVSDPWSNECVRLSGVLAPALLQQAHRGRPAGIGKAQARSDDEVLLAFGSTWNFLPSQHPASGTHI